MRFPPRLLLTCAAILAPLSAAEWQAGLATVKITPEKPAMMYGYANRIRPFTSVAQDLYAKALVLADGQGRRAVVVTTDLGAMPGWFAESVAERITAKTGLRREEILLSWSHNHAGPSLSNNATAEGDVAPVDAENRVAYTRWVGDRLVAVVAEAAARLEPATLAHGQGIINFVMNRREFTPNGVILGVNPRGLVDRSVPVLRIAATDGSVRAVLFGAACHNTTLGSRNYELCGDYAGYAQAALQERHPGVQAMFMMGCGGDANPYPREGLDNAKRHGAELAAEVARVLATKLRPIGGPLTVTLAKAELPLQSPTREQLRPLAAQSPSWQIGNARKMLAILERGERLPTHHAAPVAVWQFGRDLTLVGLSGEVVVDYVPLIERAIGPLNLWLAAYCNEAFGYLPSARVIAEGGYENRGLSTADGWFAPEAQDALVARVTALARQAGRP